MNEAQPMRRNEEPLPVLFLSGAGLPAWIWDGVVAALPTGTRTQVARYPKVADTSLTACADAVAAQVGWAEFAVVAHSLGGVVAAELLARHPTRVRAVLGVSAVIPEPGQSFVRVMPMPMRLVLGVVLRVVGTRPPAGAIREGLASGLPADLADRLVAEFLPEPKRLYLDPTSNRPRARQAAYLLTGNDHVVPVELQRRGATALGVAEVDTAPTGHLPMLERPELVAEFIRRSLLAPPALAVAG